MAIKMKVVDNHITMKVSSATIVFVGGSGELYTGSYNIIPSTYNIQTLQTKNKSMTDNVSIQKIPQFLVSNDEGGKTLIIGEEYYNG